MRSPSRKLAAATSYPRRSSSLGSAPSRPPVFSAYGRAAFSSHTAFTANPIVVPHDTKPMSTIALLETVFGSTLAFAWAVIGAWLGARREQVQTPINKPAVDRTTKQEAPTLLCAARPTRVRVCITKSTGRLSTTMTLPAAGEGRSRNAELDQRLP